MSFDYIVLTVVAVLGLGLGGVTLYVVRKQRKK
jgi:hypothetical protein